MVNIKAINILKTTGHIRVQWAYTVISNMSNFTYGLQCGWMSPMTKVLQSAKSPTGRPLTDNEIAWIAGAPSLSAVFGVMLFIQMVDKYGRKLGILVMIVFQALTWIIKMLPASTASLILARLFCGIAGGGGIHVVPMYVKEIAQSSITGMLSTVFIFAQSMGYLIIYALGGFLEYDTVLWIVVGVPILNFVLFLNAPESPAFLVKDGKEDEAAETLALLRGRNVDDEEIQNKLDEIKKDDKLFKSLHDTSIATIYRKKPWRRAFIIMYLIIIMHALNGGFSILNYAATILSTSGASIKPEVQTLSIPICMLVGSLVTLLIIDRVGRKPIMAAAFGISAVAFFCVGITTLLQHCGWDTPGWLNIIMLMVIILCYGGGVSPVPFIVIPELFNFQIRAKLMGYLVMTAWFMSFIQLVVFGTLTSNFGAHVGFFMFVIINGAGAALTILILPETKGKSMELIERELSVRITEKLRIVPSTNG